MVANSEVHRRVDTALRDVLPKSVDLSVSGTEGSSESGADFVAEIRGTRLRIAWVRHAWLSSIERIMARVDLPDVLVAERVPPASRIALTEAGIGWIETTGAAEIATDFLVVSRSGRAPGTVRKAPTRWTSSVLGVAEAILAGVQPTGSAIHEATQISVGACTKALRTLADLGLLEADAARGPRSGRRVVDTDGLLDTYVASAHELRSPVSLSVGVVWQDTVEGLAKTGRDWDTAGLAWVATGLAAAAVVAPLLTSVGTAEVYVEAATISELELVATEVGLRPIEGGRLRLAPFPTATTRHMAKVADGLRVAPWPRLVADLRRSGVRGEEAAEHLREIARGR
ncbi:MAG: hypothetical protein GY720_01600 [bacterium]|nr:hypothetical protein [bacterium]